MEDLSQISDPNAGVTSKPSGVVQISTAQAVVAPQQYRPDPMFERIRENASGIIGTELAKELAKDALNGELMAAQGSTIEEVRKAAPWHEQFFGEGATIRGAQSFVIQKAQEDYQLDLLANMPEYRKLLPEDFRKKQLAQFDKLLTGDPETDKRILLLSKDMFAKGAKEHLRNHMPYVQEMALDSFSSMLMSASQVFDSDMEAAQTEDRKEQLREEFAWKMIKPDGMDDGVYSTAIAGVAINRMKSGREHVRDMVDYMGIPLETKQLFALEDSKGAWSNVRIEEQATAIGQATDRLLDEAASLRYSDAQIITRATAFAGTLKGGFKWSAPQIASFLQAKDTAEKAQRTAAIDQSDDLAWWAGDPMWTTSVEQVTKSSDKYLARTWFTSGSNPADRAKFVDRLIQKNVPSTTLKRMASSAFANPTQGGQMNPALAGVYPLMKAVQAKNPRFFDMQFGDVSSELAIFELNGGMANAGASLLSLEQAHLVKVDPETMKTDSYVTAKASAIDRVSGSGKWDSVMKQIGKWNGPVNDLEIAASETARYFDMHYKLTGNADAAAVAAVTSFKKAHTVVNGYLVKTGNVKLSEAMGLQNDELAVVALEEALSDPTLFGAATPGLTLGKPFISGEQGAFIVWATDAAGNQFPKAMPLKTAGDKWKTNHDAELQAAADSTAKVDFEKRLSEARKFYMESVPVTADRTAAAARSQSGGLLGSRQAQAVGGRKLVYKEGVPPNISDKELVKMYNAQLNATRNTLASALAQVGGPEDILGMGSVGKQLIADQEAHLREVDANVERYLKNPTTK